MHGCLGRLPWISEIPEPDTGTGSSSSGERFSAPGSVSEEPGFITPTDARRITYEETVRFEQLHERTYRDLSFEISVIEPGSVSERVDQIKRVLSLER